MKKFTVLLLAVLLFTVSGVTAENMGGKGRFMKYMAHVNPVPNYVAFIRKNSQQLKISDAQMAQVMEWNKQNRSKMHEMVMSVIEGENKMAQASLDGVSADEINSMAEAVHNTRMQIIVGKTRCRDRMMEILDDAQWGQVTAMLANK
ncbi:MAG: Spy/CpxP family protein refolding chaperone [Candidatus Thiodiazotropha lotti]|nr:Spy/CpxP family protein refolding chaperone [Candidatus Thiodiazotropha lotti]